MFSLLSSPLKAQSSYGAIVGTVTDPSGAVVPGATVTITSLGTNEKHSVKTSAAGEFRVVSLVPANYKVEVQASTFKRFVQDTVTVQVDSTVRVDAHVQLGSATETVEVSTAPPLLETESGSVGSEVEGKVVQEMPLNGRNAMNLLALVPGVVPQSSTSGAAANNASIHTYVNGWGNYSIGGGIANESANYIDGAPNNVLGGNPPALVPTQDMVQEFKVESNAVSAEYGHFGGGVVNMATKSGTNGFHGSVYEYVRNKLLNTNDIVSNNAGQPKAHWNQNQYGVILGGPIKKDKAFFEFSWEKYSLHKASGNEEYVPTQAERGDSGAGGAIINNALHPGLCSDPAYVASGYNGVANQAFIPSSCFDPVANIMKGFYAYPNIPLNAQGDNFADQPLTGDDSYQYNARVDYNISPQQDLFGRYTRWHLQDIGEDDFKGRPGHNASVPSDFGSTGNETNNIVIGDTYTFNASTIGDIRVSYMRDHFWNYGSAEGKFDLAGLGGEYPALATQVSFKETPIFGPLIGGLEAGPWNIPVGANQIDIFEAYTLNESLTKIVGNHTFKFGGESSFRDHSGIGNYAWDAGQAIFAFFNTGDAWASFMLGAQLSDTIHTVKNSFSLDWSHGAYVTDTWHVNPKLTLNLGVRWEHPGGIYEKKDRATVFLPNVVDPSSGNGTSGYPTAGIPGTLALVNSNLYSPRNVSPDKWNLFGPRVSFAYSLNSSMVLRGGYGLSYIPPDMPIGLMAFNSPVSAVDTSCPGNGPGSWSQPFTNCPNIMGTIHQPLGRSDPNPSHNFYGQVVQSPVPTTKYPYMQQWNFTLSKQWKGDVLTEVSYAGSKGTKLPSTGVSTGTGGSFTSINELPYKYFSLGVGTGPAQGQATGGTGLSAVQPCAALGGADVSVAQCDLPYPQYGAVYDTGNNSGGQDYEAIYLIFSKRFGSAGVFNANYTYSKTQGDTDQPGFSSGGSTQDFNNPKAEKAVAAFDIPNRVIINYVLDLPFGKDHKWANSGGATNAIVGGWQVNGITTLQSGTPYSFTYNSSNPLFVAAGSNSLSATWGAGNPRPDILPGCNLKSSGSYLNKFKNNNFFNAACLVPPGTQSPTATQTSEQEMLFGNAPRNDGDVRSQFLDNFDFSVAKSTAILEKAHLIFKAEFFNLFNHPVFGNAGGECCTVISNGYDVQGQNATVNTQRLVQLSLRLNY
jgi:hypothetical protein